MKARASWWWNPPTSAKSRGARVIAEIPGYGAATDVHHLTQPHPEGDAALVTMQAACAMAGVAPEQIDYINSHGTGTPLNDIAEGNAIQRWAGDAVSSIKVSSTKSAIGHLLGGAGAVESVICLIALEHQFLPASLNVREADPVCTFDLVREPRDAEVRRVLTNSFGFGGANATLDLRQGGTRMNLAITGTGAVSAAGWGVEAMMDALARGKRIAPSLLERPLRRNHRHHAGAARSDGWSHHSQVRPTAPDQPDLQIRRGRRDRSAWRSPPRSKSAPGLRVGVIFTLTNGCVNYSNRFFGEVLADPALASPILFPETVFNAPSSHLSAMIGSTSPNDTLIGDGTGFLTGIDLAAEWIERGDVDGCLVVAAEEIDWLSAEGTVPLLAALTSHPKARPRSIWKRRMARSMILHLPDPVPYNSRDRRRPPAKSAKCWVRPTTATLC